MSKIVNKFLLAGDKFMTEMNLGQPEYTCACGRFTNSKKRIKNLKKQEIYDVVTKTNYIKLVFNMTRKF